MPDPRTMCNPCWALGAICKILCCALCFVILALFVTAYLLIGSNDEMEDWGDVLTSSELWTFDAFLIVLAAFIGLTFFLGIFLLHSMWEGTCAGFLYCARCRCCVAWAAKKNARERESRDLFVPLSSVQIQKDPESG